MAYTRNFGMRGFENIVRDGRFRVPRTGNPFVIGSPVTLDPDNPGLLKQADAGQDAGQMCGVAIYEHITKRGEDPLLSSPTDGPYRFVPLGQYAQMMHGPGTKVWFKNTDDQLLYDGRSVEGGGLLADSVITTLETITDGKSGLKPGMFLGAAANGQYAVVAAAADAWFVIEQANPSTGVVEARFTF